MDFNRTNNRKVYIEALRILAILLVLFNHTNAYSLYVSLEGTQRFFNMLLTMITRINVPLFFMITGAVTLCKKERPDTVIKKRVIKYVSILFLFELLLFALYYILPLVHIEDVDFYHKKLFRTFVLTSLSGTMMGTGSYWYLYAYLGFLLLLPFIQRSAQGMGKSDFWLLIGIHFLLSSVLPMLNAILGDWGPISLSNYFEVPLAILKAFFYPIIGYYLDKEINMAELDSKVIWVINFVVLLSLFITCYLTYYDGFTSGKFGTSYVQLFDYVMAIAAYIDFKYFDIKNGITIGTSYGSKAIVFLGSLTFGIYLLDPVWRALFYNKYWDWASSFFSVFVCSIAWVGLSFIIGGVLRLYGNISETQLSHELIVMECKI